MWGGENYFSYLLSLSKTKRITPNPTQPNQNYSGAKWMINHDAFEQTLPQIGQFQLKYGPVWCLPAADVNDCKPFYTKTINTRILFIFPR